MADLTRAQMIDKAMKRISVLPAGQSATAEEKVDVGRSLDSVHSGLRARGLAPFATSAFPDWAQEAFAQVMSYYIGPYFGVAVPRSEVTEGESELIRQLKTHSQGNPIRANYF